MEHGITHEKSAPYTQSQNGKAERRIREVARKTKCLLAVQAGAPNALWEFASDHAVYLLNRLPTTTNPGRKSSYQMWNGFKPDISRLKV